MTIPYMDYGYPVITEAPDYPLSQFEYPGYSYNNSNSRFSRGFRHNLFSVNKDNTAGLYNKKKQIEPLAMQMIGTGIDLYA